VSSEGPARGSEFTLRLPTVAAPKAEGSAPVESATPRMRILVVDDHMDSAAALAELLGAWGHDARAITDATNAIDLASQLSPDLVLLDLAMPGRNGYEIARELRRRPETRRTVLVALTGFADAEARARTREAGFDHHFSKPIQVAALQELLRSLTTQRRDGSVTAPR